MRTSGGEPIKGELAEQGEKYSQFMRFNGKNRASLGFWGSHMEAIDDYRRFKAYLRFSGSAKGRR